MKDKMTGTRIKNAGQGGKTPIPGAGPHVDDTMKKGRVAKGPGLPRKGEPERTFGNMGFTIGGRVTRGKGK